MKNQNLERKKTSNKKCENGFLNIGDENFNKKCGTRMYLSMQFNYFSIYSMMQNCTFVT